MEDDPRYLLTRFFNMHAAYLDGKLYLAVANGKEPWNGLMVCSSHEHHAEILRDYPQLVAHPILGKWLYLSRMNPQFESVANELAELARRRDSRFGVEPQRKKSPRKSKAIKASKGKENKGKQVG